jgi:hypothetical protein
MDNAATSTSLGVGVHRRRESECRCTVAGARINTMRGSEAKRHYRVGRYPMMRWQRGARLHEYVGCRRRCGTAKRRGEDGRMNLRTERESATSTGAKSMPGGTYWQDRACWRGGATVVRWCRKRPSARPLCSNPRPTRARGCLGQHKGGSGGVADAPAHAERPVQICSHVRAAKTDCAALKDGIRIRISTAPPPNLTLLQL